MWAIAVRAEGTGALRSDGESNGRKVRSRDRRRENAALCARARALLRADAVLAFRCECEDLFCRGAVVLSLAEYEASASVGSVVAPSHADAVDGYVSVELG
jgi:hypothetical protein